MCKNGCDKNDECEWCPCIDEQLENKPSKNHYKIIKQIQAILKSRDDKFIVFDEETGVQCEEVLGLVDTKESQFSLVLCFIASKGYGIIERKDYVKIVAQATIILLPEIDSDYNKILNTINQYVKPGYLWLYVDGRLCFEVTNLM